VSITACSLGAVSTCLGLAAACIKTRKHFGTPLAANPALQFKVADMATKLTSSRLSVHHAARPLGAKDPHAALHCAMAKKCSSVQVLGGPLMKQRSQEARDGQRADTIRRQAIAHRKIMSHIRSTRYWGDCFQVPVVSHRGSRARGAAEEVPHSRT